MIFLNSSSDRRTLGFVLLHFFIFVSLFFILSFFGFIKGMPISMNVMQWDAVWYKSIVKYGYIFKEHQQSNTAFFPLFPLLWKLTGLTASFISIVNLLFMVIGMLVLKKALQFSDRKLLLFLSIPSLFFCYIPYSEALFFLGGSLIIYGFKKEHWIVYIGIFLACLTRSASLVFIPALLFAKFYNVTSSHSTKKIAIESLLLVLSSLIALFISLYIQYQDTGEIFTLFDAQKQWGREFIWPELPLTTWGGANLIWLDGMAFLIGALSFVSCVILLIKKIQRRSKVVPSYYLFSIAYLVLVSLVALFFSNTPGTTSLYSLNRFVFASPFFIVFLEQAIKHKKRIDSASVFTFTIVSIIVWLLFGFLGYIEGLNHFLLPVMKTEIYFVLVSLYSLIYVFLSNKKVMDNVFSGLYIFNIIIQLYLYSQFFNGNWVG